MHKRGKRFNCILLSLVAFLLMTGFAFKPAKESAYPFGAGVFSYDHLPNEADIRCMKENDITEVYQYIAPETSDEEVHRFLKEMAVNGIDVYVLAGEPEWCYEENYASMKTVLDRTRSFNMGLSKKHKIKGVVFDIEPYLLKKWHNIPDELLEQYTNNVVKVMEERAEDEVPLSVYLCVPYSYDTSGREKVLRQLISETDGVIVMNYYKGSEKENIKREAALARWYKKRIINAYELQPGLLSQTNNSITYYKDGIDAVNDNYQDLISEYSHHDMGIAFHTLEYLRALTLQNSEKKK